MYIFILGNVVSHLQMKISVMIVMIVMIVTPAIIKIEFILSQY